MLAPGNFGCLGLRRGAYWVEQSKASDPPPEGPQEVARGDGGTGRWGGVRGFALLDPISPTPETQAAEVARGEHLVLWEA